MGPWAEGLASAGAQAQAESSMKSDEETGGQPCEPSSVLIQKVSVR